jgi:hypothetical protein
MVARQHTVMLEKTITGEQSFPVVVFNPLGWERTGDVHHQSAIARPNNVHGSFEVASRPTGGPDSGIVS